MTNSSADPARSTAVVRFAEPGAVGQLWLFWVAPLLGAAAGAATWAGLLWDRTEIASEKAAGQVQCGPPDRSDTILGQERARELPASAQLQWGGRSARDSCHQPPDADQGDHSLDIVGKHIQRHFGSDVYQPPG